MLYPICYQLFVYVISYMLFAVDIFYDADFLISSFIRAVHMYLLRFYNSISVLAVLFF